jgi:thymidylate synthase (FAD)
MALRFKKMREMEVKLMAYTPNPEEVCAKAMLGCQSKLASFKLHPAREKVVEMIRKAKKMKHLSILEHASFTFSIEGVSRVCTHQLVRHRIASYSQTSGRARDFGKVDCKDFIIPESLLKCQKYDNVIKHIKESILLYTELVSIGVPREDARFVLPEATPQNITVTMNARELLHFFYLRLSKHAQWEIRELASKMLALVKETAPVIFEDAGTYEC